MSKFSQERLDILKLCSHENDSSKWNEWREKNPTKQMLLEGVVLRDANLHTLILKEPI